MLTSEVDIKRLFSGTISALQAIQESSGSHTLENLPSVFGKVAKWIPTAQEFFESCKKHLSPAALNKGSLEDLSTAMEVCKGKAIRLDEIFYVVIRSSDASEEYQTVAKEDRLEDLMKAIFEHMIQLAKNPPFSEVVGSEVDRLEEGLRVLMAIPASLSGKRSSYLFHNSGDGWINVNTGTAPQNNNNSSGYQFNGLIHRLQFPN
ncbi:hypothetical protein BDV38DRAFT_188904 [Aspergillus pseudotamarii]|uniref:NACHT-NTPase and P-loop NTPases N-terminal domain-containing protein n=1 Tax=Aspergillus pseudotamarii TaxID=132259 RepID=A0A5N6T5M9_ASPPS|nr:uncharacterized protein BDV38DRAFT_188904 [Aspergillus pseudotamarii]KAE8141491.1 hypothetical protein BDV38DRAFT_188904 [Aspergillus pseudotamarii]